MLGVPRPTRGWGTLPDVPVAPSLPCLGVGCRRALDEPGSRGLSRTSRGLAVDLAGDVRGRVDFRPLTPVVWMHPLSDDYRDEPVDAPDDREPEPEPPGPIERVLDRLTRKSARGH
jgi:hypothetical protein